MGNCIRIPLVLALMALILPAASVRAVDFPLSATDTVIDDALNYLRQAQAADGNIGGFGVSAWVVTAIAAAGEDPHNWGDPSIVDYLRDNSENLDWNNATDLERSILAIVAAGEDPNNFGGQDYITQLKNLYDGEQIGYIETLNDDWWGILALIAAGENLSSDIIVNTGDFIKDLQNEDGGWNWEVFGDSNVDDTGAAIMALVAAGESPDDSDAVIGGLFFLMDSQNDDGGFPGPFKPTSNTASDAWAIGALVASGEVPTDWVMGPGGDNPVSNLISLQADDGGFKDNVGDEVGQEWMTAYAISALLGQPYPIGALHQDNSSPEISELTPSPGTRVHSMSCVVGASYADAISGIDVTTARILLDGADVTDDATVTVSEISYGANGLATGNHSVRVIVSDNDGNEASQSWSFQVVNGGGGGENGDRDGGDIPPGDREDMLLSPGATDVSSSVSSDGVFTQEITVQSEDGKCVLIVAENTQGLTSSGEALSQITITEMETPPAPPQNSNIIGLAYALGPDGAIFNPPITLSFTYDESLVPPGVVEKNLTIALWDETSSEWVIPEGCIVAPETNKITATIDHFSIFTVLAGTRPAAFTASDLAITPAEADIGEDVSISVLITNTGDLTGTGVVKLRIDDALEETREVTLPGGDSVTVSFSMTLDTAGTYGVNVGGLSHALEVGTRQAVDNFAASALSISPAETSVGQRVTITALVTNNGDHTGTYTVTLKIANIAVDTREVMLAAGDSKTVTFITSRDRVGTYSVDVNGLKGSFTVKEAPVVSPASPARSNRWLIGGIIAAVATSVAILLVLRRRRRRA